MKARPILMSTPMVQATLREIEQRGTGKTQTRRAIKSGARNMQEQGVEVIIHRAAGDKCYKDHTWFMRGEGGSWHDYAHEKFLRLCPYGRVGDVLWVRESGIISQSIHMPRWASRITLEITGIRVERLQDISEEDAIAEGLLKFPHKDDVAYGFMADDKHGYGSPRGAYHALWESINSAGSWADNPWVWVIEFKPYMQNVDDFMKEKSL